MRTKHALLNYYLGLMDGEKKIVCENHLPELETKPQFVGTQLVCSVCREMKNRRLQSVKLNERRLNYLPGTRN